MTATDELNPGQGEGMTGQRGYLARSQAMQARRLMEAFGEFVGADMMAARRTEILWLPRKMWNGRLVFELRCDICGRMRWEGEFVCWALMSLDHHICSWCRTRG